MSERIPSSSENKEKEALEAFKTLKAAMNFHTVPLALTQVDLDEIFDWEVEKSEADFVIQRGRLRIDSVRPFLKLIEIKNAALSGVLYWRLVTA